MNPKVQRNSNLVLCYALIAAGVLCILGTVSAAVILKNGIIERVRETPSVEGLGDFAKINNLERQIEWKDREIESAKKMPDIFEGLEEARKKSGVKANADSADSNFEQKKADRIKKLEDEKRQLIAERDELSGKSRARQMRSRSWDEWAEDYGIEILIAGVLPTGLLSLYLASLLLGRRLPARNPLSLTDFEGRCVLFLPFAIVFSAFGFFLFIWILILTY